MAPAKASHSFHTASADVFSRCTKASGTKILKPAGFRTSEI